MCNENLNETHLHILIIIHYKAYCNKKDKIFSKIFVRKILKYVHFLANY